MSRKCPPEHSESNDNLSSTSNYVSKRLLHFASLQFVLKKALHFVSKLVSIEVNVTLTSLASDVSVFPTYLGHFLKLLLADILN